MAHRPNGTQGARGDGEIGREFTPPHGVPSPGGRGRCLCKLSAGVTLPLSESQLVIRDAAPGIAVAALRGHVDAASVRTQRDQLHALPERGIYRIVLDLAGVTFLDSAGMAMLVGLLKRARAGGGDVRMVEPADDPVRHILQLTRLDLVFKMQESVEAALRDLA